MAASTHAVGRATTAYQAMGPTNGGNVVCQIVHYSLTANASANDVYQMIKVPNGAVIVNGWLAMDSTDAFTFQVGWGGDVDGFIPSSSVSASQTMQNFVRDLSGAVTKLGHQFTADDTIDVKLTAVTATVAVDWTLCVFYLTGSDGQTGGIVSS